MKRARQRERERLQAKEKDKVEKFEMINPVSNDGKATKGTGLGKVKAAAAKKGKAKTQKGGKG